MSELIECLEGPQEAIEGDEKSYVCAYLGTEAITNPAVAVYKSGGLVSPQPVTGSASVVGQTIVLPLITFPSGANGEYVICVTADYDGCAQTNKIRVNCKKKGA